MSTDQMPAAQPLTPTVWPVICVPLAVIGRLQRVFLGAATRLRDVPLSSQPWRVLDLSAAGGA